MPGVEITLNPINKNIVRQIEKIDPTIKRILLNEIKEIAKQLVQNKDELEKIFRNNPKDLNIEKLKELHKKREEVKDFLIEKLKNIFEEYDW